VGLRMTMLVAAIAAPLPAAAAPSVFGSWITDDRSAIIHVDHCGAQLCGTVERVLNPKAPARDINNPDAARRTHSMIGVPVLTGFTGSGAKWSGGQAYDPKVGKSYRAYLTLESENHLKVTGCVLFICRSLVWVRASG
jgi:uncharacterized protein (DUF2147 family)